MIHFIYLRIICYGIKKLIRVNSKYNNFYLEIIKFIINFKLTNFKIFKLLVNI